MSARHITTDPLCRLHRTPRTAWQRWRFDRNRGRGCRRCMMWRNRRDFLMRMGFGPGEAAAIATIELDLDI